MKILSTKREKNSTVFEIELDSKTWKESFAKEKKNIASNISIQGFRKGHVPANIIEERVSPDQVAYQTLERMQNTIVNDLVKDKDFEKQDCLDVVNNLQIVKINGDKAPTLKVYFDNVPKSTGFDKDDVKNITISPFKPKDIPQAFIDQQIKTILRQDTMVYPKKEQVVAKGNMAVIDFVGFKDGKEFAGGKAQNYELEIGSKSFIDNFEDQLIGLKKGDKKEVKVSFPKDYHVKDLAGAPVKFDVTIKEVKEIEYPEITKEYLAKFKIDAHDRKSLEAYIKNLMKLEEQQQYNDASFKIIQEEIVKKAKLDYYPNSLMDMHKRQVMSNYEQEAKNRGYQTLAAYKKVLGLNEDSFNLIVSNSAKSVLTVSITLEKLIAQYKLKVEEADSKDYLGKLTRYLGDASKAKEYFDKNKDYVNSVILREKLTKKMIADCKTKATK